MRLVVGLGNPGPQYHGTRHNVGFGVLDRLATAWSAPLAREKFHARVSEAQFAHERVLLVWPQTFMNLSGKTVAAATAFYKVDLATELLLVTDDFNLDLGRLRLRPGGSAGGQKGLDSTIACLGTDGFARLRVGIGPVPPRWNAADFVLAKFTADETPVVNQVLNDARQGVEAWVTREFREVVQQVNSVDRRPPEP